jgi:hypothetical protein
MLASDRAARSRTYPVVPGPTGADFRATLGSIFGHWQAGGQAVIAAAAGLPALAFRVRAQVNAVLVRLWVSRLRLFHDEVSNIGSELFTMTLLHQENRVHRSSKKAVAHKGKDDLAQGTVDDAPVEGVGPCLV